MDLSWSNHLKADAPTIVKNIKDDVKKHMDFISHHMRKFDNVKMALDEGQIMLGRILCRNCQFDVKTKRTELHSKNGTTHKKTKLMKLSQERQQIVNEITNMFIQLDRAQNEEGDVEYVTEGEYYRQEMSDMESKHRDKVFDLQDEMRDMEKKYNEVQNKMKEVDSKHKREVQEKIREVENKCKREVQDKIREVENKYKKTVQDKETEVRNIRRQLEKMTTERDDYKKKNDSMSTKLKSYEKTDSELRDLKREHKRLYEDLNKKETSITKLNKELQIKEEDIKRYRPSSTGYRTRSSGYSRDDEVARFKEEINSTEEELRKSRRENENLKSDLEGLSEENKKQRSEKHSLEKTIDSRKAELQKSMKDKDKLKLERDELQEEKYALKETIESKVEELQRSMRENENLKSEQINTICSLQKENRSLKETLEKKDGELKSMQLELETLQKAKRKQIVMGLWKERSGMGKTMVDMITKELMRRVGGQLGRDNIDLTIRPCTTTSDISGVPLLVLCLNMSRIGTNIQDAIEGLQADKTNVFVLVLHHTSKDNLSSLTPTSLRITGSELRKLGGIIDMAFSSDSGVYECDLNNNAAEKITSIMRKYMTA